MSDTPEEKAEARAIRRRWITIGELVAVAGVIIAGTSLWINWSGDRTRKAEARAEKVAEVRAKSRYVVKAAPFESGQLGLVRDERHALGDVTIIFPTELGVPEQHPAAQTIDSAAFSQALLKATDGGPDSQTGLLPVRLKVQYWIDDSEQHTSGIYDIVWKTEGRPLRGRALKLIGLRLRQPGGDQAALDAAWSREAPKR